MTRYLSSKAVGVGNVAILGGALDRAPRPYTVAELADITHLPLHVVKAFLFRNANQGKISVRDTPRPDGRCGRHVREYWRGTLGIWDTFSEGVLEMNEDTEQQIIDGQRPVSWKEPSRTVWSIDETGTVATMRDKNIVRLGHMERAARTREGLTIRIEGGTSVTFRRPRP